MALTRKGIRGRRSGSRLVRPVSCRGPLRVAWPGTDRAPGSGEVPDPGSGNAIRCRSNPPASQGWSTRGSARRAPHDRGNGDRWPQTGRGQCIERARLRGDIGGAYRRAAEALADLPVERPPPTSIAAISTKNVVTKHRELFVTTGAEGTLRFKKGTWGRIKPTDPPTSVLVRAHRGRGARAVNSAELPVTPARVVGWLGSRPALGARCSPCGTCRPR